MKDKKADEYMMSMENPRKDIYILSEKERKKMERKIREIKQQKITLELLTHFTDEEVRWLVGYFSQTPASTTQDLYGMFNLYGREIDSEADSFLYKELKGKKIIELGDNGNETNRDFFLGLDAKSYETVDPKYNVDGLTYLMRQPEDSAVVCSFGVLDRGVLYNDVSKFDKALLKYTTELGKEIYRVTPRGSITFHGLDIDYDLKQAGFKEDKSSPKSLNTLVGSSHGGFKVLRKD